MAIKEISLADSGLEDIIATSTSVCSIENGVLAYRGYNIDELAEKATFGEVTYLLFYGQLPTRVQLRELEDQIAEGGKIPAAHLALIRQFPMNVPPMDWLRTAVSALSFYDPDYKDNSAEANLRKSIRLAGQIPTLVAAFDQLRKKKGILEPRKGMSQAWNFLYMLTGKEPNAVSMKTFDVCLILHADHELNASTFSARVTAATLSDLHSAITSAIGTLKGSLHGGANEAVFKILMEIDAAGADPVEYVKGMLAQKKKIPGFGHRVYHTED